MENKKRGRSGQVLSEEREANRARHDVPPVPLEVYHMPSIVMTLWGVSVTHAASIEANSASIKANSASIESVRNEVSKLKKSDEQIRNIVTAFTKQKEKLANDVKSIKAHKRDGNTMYHMKKRMDFVEYSIEKLKECRNKLEIIYEFCRDLMEAQYEERRDEEEKHRAKEEERRD